MVSPARPTATLEFPRIPPPPAPESVLGVTLGSYRRRARTPNTCATMSAGEYTTSE